MILRERDLDVNVLSTARGHLRTKKEKGGGVGVGGSRAVAVAGGRLINFSYLKPYSPLTKKEGKKEKEMGICMWGTYSSYVFLTFTT